ncbi:uncharacterized protein V6R79_009155 [Siganus canaliculatus]
MERKGPVGKMGVRARARAGYIFIPPTLEVCEEESVKKKGHIFKVLHKKATLVICYVDCCNTVIRSWIEFDYIFSETRKKLRGRDLGKDNVWLLRTSALKAAFTDKEQAYYRSRKSLTSHLGGFDSPNSGPLLTTHNQSHLSTGSQLINQLKTHTKPQ